MRPPERGPIPDLDLVLREANRLLATSGLPQCRSIEPAADQDTANVNLVGYAPDGRYAIKLRVRDLGTFERQLCVANLLRERTGLPIPEHLCHSDEDAELPLLVMEHMPGKQVRLLFQTASTARADAIARDWGRCIARLHRTSVEAGECGGWPPIEATHGAYIGWQREKVREVLGLLEEHDDWPEDDIAQIGDYLSRRERAFDQPAAPGLVKRDLGLRDALGLLEPEPHISALLDWELVEPGDTLWALVDVFVMVYVGGLKRIWASFRDGYEAETGVPIASGDALEYYTLVRALIALTWREQDAPRRERARELVRTVLGGESPVMA